jgi:hypothetical protein
MVTTALSAANDQQRQGKALQVEPHSGSPIYTAQEQSNGVGLDQLARVMLPGRPSQARAGDPAHRVEAWITRGHGKG